MGDPVHEFLIDAAVLLHRHGTPSHRLERVMTKVARSLGAQGVFLYTPTALVVSLNGESGEQTYMRRVDSGPINVDKLIRFDAMLGDLEAHRITLSDARKQMLEIAEAPPPYSTPMTMCACAISCGAVAVFFRGGPVEVISAAIIGLLVASLEVQQSRTQFAGLCTRVRPMIGPPTLCGYSLGYGPITLQARSRILQILRESHSRQPVANAHGSCRD
jgi:uncharacterized membrane protein YjjP (DUF1212 family)